MAKRKIELFIEIHNEKEFETVLKNNLDQLICAEIYSYAFGSCTALDRLFTTIKIDWSNGKIILLKVPADEIEALQRFRDQSEPVYMFILNAKATKVFRGVDTVKFAEVTKKELYYYNQAQAGFSSDRFSKDQERLVSHRPVYGLDEPTPDEKEWMAVRALEKQQEATSLVSRRSERQAVRKRHRAELMVPFLTDVNFVLFWPHCFHAHPELYEQWDANNIVMVGRELVELSEEKIKDIFYAGDAPLNEASMHKLMSGPALAICFRLLDDDVDFVPLVRRILYEEIPPCESKSMNDLKQLKTAFDRYKTYSPTREEVWQQRKEERRLKKEEEKRRRARFLSETRRINRQALEEALEKKRQEREQRKLELLRSGNLSALDQMNEESEDELPDNVEPEETADEEAAEECIVEEDEEEYFPPPGLLIPGFYAPPNDIAKSNGLAVLFPKLVLERVTPQPEFLPRHVLVLLEISKRHKAIEVIAPYKKAIIHMGIFKATTPFDCVHIAYTVKQFDTLDSTSLNFIRGSGFFKGRLMLYKFKSYCNDITVKMANHSLFSIQQVDTYPPGGSTPWINECPALVTSVDHLKLAFMLSVEVDVPLLHLMDLNPLHVSRDCSSGEEECAAMFSVDYGDDYNQLEDFE